uniref:Uncharacterized protein n=1 Tax=Aegilops tauschii subsp. strangulata TaxID=200361 RepID=A0A452YHX0_AEGTS
MKAQHPVQKRTIGEGIKETVKNFAMAPINLRFLCLMALLMISSTCMSSQVSESNIGSASISRRAYEL